MRRATLSSVYRAGQDVRIHHLHLNVDKLCVHADTRYRIDGDVGGAGSEDCLKVNVYAPVGAKKGDMRMCGLLQPFYYLH